MNFLHYYIYYIVMYMYMYYYVLMYMYYICTCTVCIDYCIHVQVLLITYSRHYFVHIWPYLLLIV